MRSVVLAACLLMTVFSATADAKRYEWAGAIFDPLVTGSDWFGRSAAIEGNLLVVGDPSDSTNAEFAGTVHVFDLDSGHLLHALEDPAPARLNRFGTSVAIEGGEIVVGSSPVTGWCDPISRMERGCPEETIHVFDSVTGELLDSLDDPTPTTFHDDYGFYVGISDGNIVVADGLAGGSHEHQVHIFNRHNRELEKTLHDTPSISFSNGLHIATGEHEIAVGMPWASSEGVSSSGKVEVYSTEGHALVATFTDPETERSGRFGMAVAMDDQYTLIGAPGYGAGDSSWYRSWQDGRVYLFDNSKNELVWKFDGSALPPDYVLQDLGSILALDNGVAAIHVSMVAPSGDIENQVFLVDVHTGVPIQVIDGAKPSDAAGYWQLLAFDSGVLVSASRENSNPDGRDRLNIFRLVPEPASHLLCCLAFAVAASRRPRR